MATIGCLVSGHCEEEAVPILIRKVLHDSLIFDVQVGRVIRKAENKILKRGDNTLERSVLRLRRSDDAVLVVIDLEDDCPAQEGPALLVRAKALCEKPVAVVCIYRELETWFLWDAENLWHHERLDNPESKRDAKRWLRANVIPNYNEVADGPGLCQRFNLEVVRERSDSFRVFCDRVLQIASTLRR